MESLQLRALTGGLPLTGKVGGGLFSLGSLQTLVCQVYTLVFAPHLFGLACRLGLSGGPLQGQGFPEAFPKTLRPKHSQAAEAPWRMVACAYFTCAPSAKWLAALTSQVGSPRPGSTKLWVEAVEE